MSFRRRKGTILVLEQLARDVTGWGAHAVEFFQELSCTQYMNHVRPGNPYAPDLRSWEPREYMNTGFDGTPHTVDVRRIALGRGRQNIQNVGIFLWSLQAYGLTKTPAVPVAGHPLCLRVNPLGADAPLFNHPVPQGADISAPALPVNVPARLSRHVLCADLQTGAQATYYGQGKSLALYFDGKLVNPSGLRVCDLSGSEGQWSNLPGVGSTCVAAIDPQLGRIALRPATAGSPVPQTVEVSWYYGFNAELGGGEYARTDAATAGEVQTPVNVSAGGDLQAALDSLNGNGVVQITDSGVYSAPGGLRITVRAQGHVELRAADGCRPTLLVGKDISVSGGEESTSDLIGLCIGYARPSPGAALPPALVYAPSKPLNKLTYLGLTHCTLVPQGEPLYGDRPTLVAEPSGLAVVIQKSIVGGLRVSAWASASLSNSILDATAPVDIAYAGLDTASGDAAGGALTMTCCTVVGQVRATLLNLVSNCLVLAELSPSELWLSPPNQAAAPLWTGRRQEGCVRYSFLPPGAAVPRQFACVVRGPASPAPVFISLRYGDPGYGKLAASTDDSVRRGADDGGEMGAFHFLGAPQRESNLRTRMQEYLPVGLEYGIFYQT